MTDAKEIRKLKMKLETNIAHLLNKFIEETGGAMVHSIDIRVDDVSTYADLQAGMPKFIVADVTCDVRI